MPPKAKLSREQILDAAFAMLRRDGEGALNIRAIAAETGCSTQPVMSHFATAEGLKSELYAMADAYHTQYIIQEEPQDENPMLGIGLRYVRFAAQEPHLFRFLFQSDRLGTDDYGKLVHNEALSPMFRMLSKQAGITQSQAEDAFEAIFLTTHGFACLLANNAMQYDEAYYVKAVTAVFYGVIGAMKGGQL